jgi:hypothetical protein
VRICMSPTSSTSTIFRVEPDRDDWERSIVETVERERTEACTMLGSLPGNWSYYCREGNPAHLLASMTRMTP